MGKSKVKLLIYSFFILFSFNTLLDKLCGFRSAPYTWSKIVDTLPITMIVCLLGSIWFTFFTNNQEIISWLDDKSEKRHKKRSLPKDSDGEILDN